jgi:hypothetical protein
VFFLLGLFLVSTAIGVAQLRREPPEGWPWGLGPRWLVNRTALDPAGAWRRQTWLGLVFSVAGAVASAVWLVVR